MKKILLISAVLAAACSFSACATGGGGAGPVPGGVELAISVASDGAALVLQRNPQAVPVLRSISLGIDAVITEGSLTPEQLATFVSTIDKDGRLAPEERFIIGRAVMRVHQLLVVYGGGPDLNIGDPKIRAALVRVKQGIDDTLAFHDALNSQPRAG